MTLTDLLRSTAVSVLLSCAGPQIATRPYSNPATRTHNAYLNIRDILADLCGSSLGDSYPSCRHFTFDQDGFYCEQLTAEHTMNATSFRWEEIESVMCVESEPIVNITGKYDQNWIGVNGTTQCQDLARAMTLYLRGRQ